MLSMRFQFSISALLLATAFAAICLSGYAATLAAFQNSFANRGNWTFLITRGMAAYLPLWLPFVFVAFAVGRKAFITRIVIAFAICEALAVAASYFAIRQLLEN
jgi:hypothetical protein